MFRQGWLAVHWLPRSVGRKRAGRFKHAWIFLHDPVCVLPQIGHGDKSLNVTFISGTDWFWMEKMISKTTTKKQWLQPQAGCERLDLYHRGHVGEAIYYVPAFNQFSTDSFFLPRLLRHWDWDSSVGHAKCAPSRHHSTESGWERHRVSVSSSEPQRLLLRK